MLEEFLQDSEYTFVELNNQNVYKVECPKGHVSYTSLQQQRFQILADISIWAFGLGFPDLAVIRAYSALEVFETYFIECVAYDSGHLKIAVDSLKKELKLAERRRGAFLISFRSMLKEHPVAAPDLPNFDNLVSLRNQIVHGGKLVSTDEARVYCQEVFDFIADMIKWMRTHITEAMTQCTFSHVKNNKDTVPPNADFSFMSIPTIVRLDLADLTQMRIDEAFQVLLATRSFIRPDL